MNDASLSIKDNACKLPIDYALFSKDLLPLTLQVLQAGTIKQNYESKLSPNNNVFDLSRLQEPETKEYFQAVTFLDTQLL